MHFMLRVCGLTQREVGNLMWMPVDRGQKSSFRVDVIYMDDP